MNLQVPSYCEHFEYLKISQSLYKQKQPACKYCFLGPVNIWICLSKGCSSYVCGKNNFQHLQSHLEQSRRIKKFHSIFMNVATTEIKCIQCNIQIGDTDIPSNQKMKKKQDPYIFRIKLLPALNDLVSHKIVGQLQNSQGHKKVSCGLVGLFSTKYNYSINAAIQFLSHSRFIRDFVLQIKPVQANKILLALKEVMKQIKSAQFRAVYSDAVSELLYKQFPKLYGYKRKDPFEIILYLFNVINEETLFYSIINHNGQDTDQWDLFYKKNTIKPNYIIYDVIQSTLSLNYNCLKCSKPSSVSNSIQFLKLSIPKKKRKTKQLEKQLASHRCESPLKNRRKSLLNVFKQQEFPITLVQLIIELMKSPLHKEMNCESCAQPLKKMKIHFETLPDILIIQIARINKDGSIDETPVQLTTDSLDLGPFTNIPDQQILYDFESAVCIQKGCLFPVLVVGQFNKQKYVIRNEIVELSKQKLNPYLLCYKKRASQSSKQKLTEIRDDIQSKSEKKYILPDFWLVQLENGIERQLRNTFVCRHNSLKPFIQTKMQKQTLVSAMVYEDLNHFYYNLKLNNTSFIKRKSSKSNEQSPKKLQRWLQKENFDIYQNQVCYICSQQVDQLEFRRKKQRQYVLILDKLKAQNLPFCMISASWIKKWSNFLYSKDRISYMPKGYPLPLSIDNKSLLQGNKCKPNLVKNENYKVLNIYLWKFLKELYGGGPEIRYKWKQGRQSLDQEMIFDIKSKATDLKQIFSSKYIQSPKKLMTSLSFIDKSSFIEEGNQSFLKPVPACQDLMEQQL